MDKQELKKRVYVLALRILKILDQLPNQKAYWSLGDQLLRAASSIGANIIEAQAGSSKKDFINFYHYALKSANETKFWLCLLRDSQKMPKGLIEPILAETVELANILGASLLTLKNKRKI
ncbi:four helix bundle protein [bacterium (Candidatus Torokbacteria) CG09_land_8_20_14_0_10_42_11]|nr:MAG: four helix bundle protein [bacterium (Candidatus Torokbacteria) CG09_land_8_20_14_0_10_42_11]